MTDQDLKPRFQTRLVHGANPGRTDQGALPGPVYFSTAYEHASAEEMEQVFLRKQAGLIYSRLQNPTVSAYEQRVTDLCEARGSVALATGMAAISQGLLALLRPGDEILAGQHLFGGTFTLFTRTLRDLDITVRFFDPRNLAQAEALISPKTRLVFVEAIANPAVVVPDFQQVRALCDTHGLPLLADVTALSPYLFDGELLGVDLAFFSASKLIGGAATALGGLIVDTGRCEWGAMEHLNLGPYAAKGGGALLAKLRGQLMADVGPTLSPMSAFLHLTGMESLGLRMEFQCASTLAVCRYLTEHPKVSGVLYPGLPEDEFHVLAMRQFKGKAGTTLALLLPGRQACFDFLDRLKLIKRATNLGDTRSIAIHPASTIYATQWPAEREQLGVSEGLIRLSIGIEDPQDLVEDLEQALG